MNHLFVLQLLFACYLTLPVYVICSSEKVETTTEFDAGRFKAFIELANNERLNQYPNPLDLAIQLADAWYMIDSHRHSVTSSEIMKPYMVQIDDVVRDFFKANINELNKSLADLFSESKSQTVERWNKWVALVNEQAEIEGKYLNKNEFDDHLNPRFNPNQAEVLIRMAKDDVEAQKAFTQGKGFCTLSKYLDANLLENDFDFKISRVLYLVWEAWKHNLLPKELTQTSSNIGHHLLLIRVCRHMSFQPLTSASDLSFMIDNFIMGLEEKFAVKDKGPEADKKLRSACDPKQSQIYEILDHLNSRISQTSASKQNTKISQTTNENMMKEAKSIILANCLSFIKKEAELGLRELYKTKDSSGVNLAQLKSIIYQWLDIMSKADARVWSIVNYHKARTQKNNYLAMSLEDRLRSGLLGLLNPRVDFELADQLQKTARKSSYAEDAYLNGEGLCMNLRNSDKISFVYDTFGALLVHSFPHEGFDGTVSEVESKQGSSDNLLISLNNLMILCEQLKKEAIDRNLQSISVQPIRQKKSGIRDKFNNFFNSS